MKVFQYIGGKFVQVGFADDIRSYLKMAYDIHWYTADDLDKGWEQKINEAGAFYMYNTVLADGRRCVTYNVSEEALLNEIKLFN